MSIYYKVWKPKSRYHIDQIQENLGRMENKSCRKQLYLITGRFFTKPSLHGIQNTCVLTSFDINIYHKNSSHLNGDMDMHKYRKREGAVLDEGPLLNFRQLHYMSIPEEATQTSNPRWD
jgi:hypothetical protein